MDWRSVKFDWNHVKAFLVTAEEGSLSAAARALGTTQPTLGRQVSALEEELGVVLFERTAGGIELTPNGLNLLELARGMGDAASHFSLVASGQCNEIEGNVCITATDIFSAFVLPPILKKLRLKEPGITIEVIASNDNTDLKRREADIAIRGHQPNQSELIAKKLSDIRAHLYAAPSYLDQLGCPDFPEAFNNADFIGFQNNDRFIEVLGKYGFDLTNKNFPVTTENHIVYWELVKSGAGIGIMPEGIGSQESLVEEILPKLDPILSEVWIVAHREVKTNRRIRFVFDFLVQELSNQFVA